MSSSSSSGSTGLPPLPDPLYGVTSDDITNQANLVDALGSFSRKPTVRVVFDEGQAPSYYAQAVPAAHAVSYVMGEILDSQYVSTYSVADYLQRTSDYLAAFPDDVDLWEVGNEINGEWLIASNGTNQDVVDKMTGAFDLVKAAGKRTELTLYYNQGCYSSADHEMFTWGSANIPQRMLTGLDYVLISYYEDDCNGLQPDWPTVFAQLHQMFPNSKIGIGECGTVDTSQKAAYIDRYYGMNITVPGYVGGYFWWYFYEDAVPKTQPLWSTLDQAFQTMP